MRANAQTAFDSRNRLLRPRPPHPTSVRTTKNAHRERILVRCQVEVHVVEVACHGDVERGRRPAGVLQVRLCRDRRFIKPGECHGDEELGIVPPPQVDLA